MLARLSYRLPAARLRCTLPTATYSTESINYCRNLVRDKDYDAYLSCLLFPEPQRDACFSILAFNQEMQSIRHQSNNNAMAGRMRFQWWRSLIDDIYIHAKGESGGNRTGKALSQHPVVEVLSDSVQKYNLTQRWLERLLEVGQLIIPSTIPLLLMLSVLYLMVYRQDNLDWIFSGLKVCPRWKILQRGHTLRSSICKTSCWG